MLRKLHDAFGGEGLTLSYAEGSWFESSQAYFGERSSVGRAPGCGSGGRGFDPHRSPHFIQVFARVAELADALDLGSSGETRESSSLSSRTISFFTYLSLALL